MAQSRLSSILASWPQDLPQGIIHADLFPNNVLFIGDKLTGLIDFYFACEDIFAYDIGICLNSWCFDADGSFNLTKSRALIRGYQSVRPLSEAEINAIPVLAAGSAMRFFLTRALHYIAIPIGVLVGVVFFNEVITAKFLLGTAVIVGVNYYIFLRERAAARVT